MKISNWPYFDKEQINAVSDILRRGAVNGNSIETRSFEIEFAKYINVKKAVAISNGSLALSSAYLSIGIGRGDEVITTPRTFVATAASAALLGAIPVFADVDRDSGNLCPKSVEALINKKTKAIIVVHLAGWPADMDSICKLAKKYKLSIIEDCAQAHGAGIYKDGKLKKVGSFGDVSAWSFCQEKIISTGGEGGMITTNNENLYKKILSFKDHGKNVDFLEKQKKLRSKILSVENSDNKKRKDKFVWVHDQFGSNFRLTEIQCCIGRMQLKLLDNWNKLRENNANIITQELDNLSILRIPKVSSTIKHAWYKFYCYLNTEELSSEWTRDRIINEINSFGYPCFSGSCSEIYLEKCFNKKGFYPEKRLPIAKELGETSLMFLIDQTITSENMIQYMNVVKRVLKKAKK